MSGHVFTTDAGQGKGLGTSPGQSGAEVSASRPQGLGGSNSWLIKLEDGSGFVLLEDGTGYIVLEAGP